VIYTTVQKAALCAALFSSCICLADKSVVESVRCKHVSGAIEISFNSPKKEDTLIITTSRQSNVSTSINNGTVMFRFRKRDMPLVVKTAEEKAYELNYDCLLESKIP
jgi:hypothetical protein